MAVVRLTPTAAREFEELPLPIKARVLALFGRLRKWPDVGGCKPLSGSFADCWRMRTGDYRLRFGVVGDRVMVEAIGHRDGFYEG